ncbi:hypothetical protein BGX29_000082 [Mortierella sp. GBA35]|nr:hypothetical protein BGX29_000082 [Mortierella sp. GBA35]
MVAIKEVDTQLMQRNNSGVHSRTIQFKVSTRLDPKQEQLRKKYKAVNEPSSSPTAGRSNFAPSAASVPYSGNASSSSATSTVTEDRNGFRFPAKTLFSKDRLQISWPEPRPIGPGLHNLGNTCFLNSVLQCLTYTAPLVNYLRSNNHRRNACNTTNFCMMCELEKHVDACLSGRRKPIEPSAIARRLKSIGKQFRIGRQEDAHEFARCLVDALQKSCLVGYDSKLDNRIKETTAIHQIFGGYFQSQIKCMSCGHESNTFDSYLDVSLDIKGLESVRGAFHEFIKPEILRKDNQYKCEKCKVLVDAKKQMTIYDAPEVLCVHLKRFTYTGQKINRHVRFETSLNLNPFMSNNKDHPDLTYSLYAVLVHDGGSCHVGHYYCYVKGSNGVWNCMNDSGVEQVRLQTVLEEKAYMLFYTRDEKRSTKSAPTNRLNGMNGANGVKAIGMVNGMVNGIKANGVANGMANGVKTAPTQAKRPRLDDDDEVGTKVDRSAVGPKDKRAKVDEQAAPINMQGLSKEEKIWSKKERKKAKKQEKKLEKKLNASKAAAPLNDYELATMPTPFASSTVPSTTPPTRSIFGVLVPNGVAPSKNQSPLADLDVAPTSMAPTIRPSTTKVPAARHLDVSITVVAKPPVAEKLPQAKLIEHKQADDQDVDMAMGEVAEEVEQDGWTVKSRPTTKAIVVAHNETSVSKREKLQALIARESEFKSADVKEAILGEQRHMLGSKVSTWEEPSYALTKAREDVLRSLKPKHHRPDAYDVDYDRGKVKKVKTKNITDGPAVGAQVANKFQKEQDVRNIIKPKFNKNNKNRGKKIPSEL